MTTENKRVAAYLPRHLYDWLEAFKEENSLSESKAIISILAAHFGVAQEVSQKVAHKFVTVEQFTELHEKVAQISELLSELKKDQKAKFIQSDLLSGLPSESPSKLKIEPESEPKSVLLNSEAKHSCPKCGSISLMKNGRSKDGRQKYKCKDCKANFVTQK